VAAATADRSGLPSGRRGRSGRHGACAVRRCRRCRGDSPVGCRASPLTSRRRGRWRVPTAASRIQAVAHRGCEEPRGAGVRLEATRPQWADAARSFSCRS
jgi:hypothetical protein